MSVPSFLGRTPSETEGVIDGVVKRHSSAIVENAKTLGGNIYRYRISREIRLFGKAHRPATGAAPCAVNAVIDQIKDAIFKRDVACDHRHEEFLRRIRNCLLCRFANSHVDRLYVIPQFSLSRPPEIN